MTIIFPSTVFENYTSTIPQTHSRVFQKSLQKSTTLKSIKSDFITITPAITTKEPTKKPRVALVDLPQNPNKILFHSYRCILCQLESPIENFKMAAVNRCVATTQIFRHSAICARILISGDRQSKVYPNQITTDHPLFQVT